MGALYPAYLPKATFAIAAKNYAEADMKFFGPVQFYLIILLVSVIFWQDQRLNLIGLVLIEGKNRRNESLRVSWIS